MYHGTSLEKAQLGCTPTTMRASKKRSEKVLGRVLGKGSQQGS